MNLLCEDIIQHIISFLQNNDSYNLIKTSKFIYNIGKKYGFLKYITFNHNNGLLMERFYEHYKSLHTLSLHHINDPQLWIPADWPNKVYFYNCRFSYNIDLGKMNIPKTKEITFYNIFYKNSKKINITDTSNTFSISEINDNFSIKITAIKK
jgi:hypothetical protein